MGKTVRYISKNDMKNLKETVGKNVSVEFVSGSHITRETGILKIVENFENIQVGCLGLPFIGSDTAIRSITYDGKVLYENINITTRYPPKTCRQIDSLRLRTFGVNAGISREFEFRKDMLRI